MPLNYVMMMIFIAAFIMSVVLHEVAHGWVARACGDPTAEIAGRLTLNPIKHIDPVMTIAVPLVLLYATRGQMLFGGAKPVPVNPYMLRGGEKDDLKVSLAGVAVNFSIALIFGLPLRFWQPEQVGFMLFAMIAISNLILALFNLIPIPPLDGSHVLRYLLARVSPELAAAYERLGMFGLVLVIMFMSFGGHVVLGIAISVVWTFVFNMTDVAWWEVMSRFWGIL